MPAIDDILIDTFRPGDAEAFDTLNRAWLVRYGLLEEADERQLADPVGRIIEPGGQVFVARRDGAVVGTCALVPHGPGELELAKLVVAPDARGLGLGRRLVEVSLDWARNRGARRLVLLSNSQLAAAIALYERLGFRHAPIPPGSPYLTADVYMEMDLVTQDD